MLVNPYDDRRVSLQCPHGKGTLDIVLALLIHQKANATSFEESKLE